MEETTGAGEVTGAGRSAINGGSGPAGGIEPAGTAGPNGGAEPAGGIEPAGTAGRGVEPGRQDAEHLGEPVRFDTKIGVVLRDDLAVWQRLNVTSFLVSGIAATVPDVTGEPYRDADGTTYLPMFRQPVMVFAATAVQLATVARRAVDRGVTPSIYTEELFTTGDDRNNRAAVAAVPREKLALVGLALRADRKVADKILKGLRLHD
ncbi:MAG: DUF2000 family protein [Frankia sp.]